MMGELLNMDVVNVPVYDGLQASATALRMRPHHRRREALVSRTVSTDRLSKFRDYCGHDMAIRLIGYDRAMGQLDLELLRSHISDQTASVYFDNPSYLASSSCTARRSPAWPTTTAPCVSSASTPSRWAS